MGSFDMERRRIAAVGIGTLTLVASTLLATDAPGAATAATTAPSTSAAPPAVAHKATMQVGFTDVTAIGGLAEPVSVAFAGDGTAFIALKTGVIKSFDYDNKLDAFEPAATSTDFADLSVAVNNYGDRGMTGIAVDPQFPARPYVYVNYTYNRDPRDNPPVVPKWGVPGQQYDDCPQEADLQAPVKTGCPVMDRVSRLTATKTALGWTMAPNGELPLVTDGCAQFSSHSSGDVVFGPDGLLYASAGDGASFRGQDFGQANNPCGDPVNEGGSLRAQDQRHDGGVSDPLGIDGTIFRLHPDAPLTPTQASAGQWLVAMGQRNPWRLTFRQGKEQLWSVDVGSSNWEEINYLLDAPTTGLINRGWPCYEGTTGLSLRNAAWDALDKPICEELYGEGAGAVAAPFFSYRTRTGATPLTPGENCPVVSSSMSGVAFSQLGSHWPKAYQDVAVLLRLPARLHLAAREGRRRPARPGLGPGLRAGRRVTGRPDHRSGRRPLLRRLRDRERRRRPGRGRRAPHQVHRRRVVHPEVVAQEGEDQGQRPQAARRRTAPSSPRAPS